MGAHENRPVRTEWFAKGRETSSPSGKREERPKSEERKEAGWQVVLSKFTQCVGTGSSIAEKCAEEERLPEKKERKGVRETRKWMV